MVSNPETPAKWIWIGLLIGIVVIDVVLLTLGKNTLSQYMQHQSHRHPWLKWLTIGGLVVLVWHVFWGFPW